jgi:diaminopimelate epimerase
VTLGALKEDVARTTESESAVDLHFTKYTSFGNTFIIVDETLTPLDNDQQRAQFARWVLNGDFGIGGTDNVLYLSRPGPSTVDADGRTADFVFRIFEQDGSETLSCGNGLLSTAAALERLHGGREWGVFTEMPTGTPKLVHVGIDASPGKTWVNVGWPRATSTELYRRPGDTPESGIDEVTDLVVPIPQGLDWTEGLPETVTLSGYLNFTGEPHLALPVGHGLPEVLEDHIFPTLGQEPGVALIGLPPTQEMRTSSLLVDHIGRHVNLTYTDRFPQGVHLNFCRVVDPSGLIEYRTWERAINCETLACGSGAVAMAYVAQTLGLVPGKETTFWPHKCRWFQPDASLRVTETESGWVLTGQPRLVCAGDVRRPA